MAQTNGLRASFSLEEFLHLSALNAFAVAQPILDRLAANPGYLWRRNISGMDVIATIIILLTTIPVGSCLIIGLLRWQGLARSADVALKCLISFLFLMSFLIAARWIAESLSFGHYGVPQSLLALLALFSAGLAVRLYSRHEAIRLVLSICACGVVLFPMSFFSSAAIQEQVLGISRQKEVAVPAPNPAPVVMIVFDGLCGMALLDEHHEIDRVRYPAFARLADVSDFYRNATTVHTRTDHAVPAILCSTIPAENRVPVEADYPTSLFRMIHRTQQYKMTVAEPVSHFFKALKIPKRRLQSTSGTQIGTLLATLLKVYVDISMPQEIDLNLVSIPKEWFGMGPFAWASEASVIDGEIVSGWDSGRELQCDQFIQAITNTDEPTFRFLHVVIPHDPWNLLPSGKSYVRYGNNFDSIVGSDEELWADDGWLVNQGWQRYLLQLQFADRALGQILDRLERTGQLDRSLVVVTADHGMAFAPGFNRRVPSAMTLPDIASVPLIIKQPFQKRPEISDRNVETIDVTPTIADVLGLQADGAWEGESLLREHAERPRKTLISPPDTIVFEAAFAQRYRYLDRMIDAFGTGSGDDRLQKLNIVPELIGRQTAGLTLGNPAAFNTDLYHGGGDIDPKFSNFVPCYLQGRLSIDHSDASPRILAIALNGVVLATTRTTRDPDFAGEWSAMLPEDAFLPAGNRVQLFEVETGGLEIILHEIALKPFPS